MITYSREEARRILLRYHNLDGHENLIGINGIRTIMNRIGSIQYDPLNVVGRNADLVLQARIKGYKQKYLNSLLYEEHSLVDGFDKEMCIYNTKDFGEFTKVREEHSKSTMVMLGHREQLGALDILEDVKAFVSKYGVTGTKDITIGEVRESRWGHKKLSSAALDYLYTKGELCVAKKNGTQKYFDLTERVIPKDYYQSYCDKEIDEFLDWYIERRIKCLGFVWDRRGGAWQGHFLDQKDLRQNTLMRLIEKEKLSTFRIEGITSEFYTGTWIDAFTDMSGKQNDYVRFMAPLDNIMWDRTMLEQLFDFTYRWEVYTPVNKRKYGYYVIPVIYNNQFIARFEPESVSKVGEFQIKNWWWESNIKPNHQMYMAILDEMQNFSDFLGIKCCKKNIEMIGR